MNGQLSYVYPCVSLINQVFVIYSFTIYSLERGQTPTPSPPPFINKLHLLVTPIFRVLLIFSQVGHVVKWTLGPLDQVYCKLSIDLCTGRSDFKACVRRKKGMFWSIANRE